MEMNPIIWLLLTLLNLYKWVVIVWAVLSTLISFNVVNLYQPLVSRVYYALQQLVEPALRPLRRYLPAPSGIDLSAIVLIILIQFAQYSLVWVDARV